MNIEQKPEATITFKLKTNTGARVEGTLGITLEQWKEAFKILCPKKEQK
jgi:hypothetical protein